MAGPDRVCAAVDCSKPVHSRGLCLPHYKTLHGRAAPPERPERPIRRCSIDGCDNKHYGKGFCEPHYRIWRRTTRTTKPAPKPKPVSPPGIDIPKLAATKPLPGWQHWAACKDMDRDLFFPARGGTLQQVKELCAGCPVRYACLATHLDGPDGSLYVDPGIWGGTSERERRQIRRDLRAHRQQGDAA
jgi:hypothetical protein